MKDGDVDIAKIVGQGKYPYKNREWKPLQPHDYMLKERHEAYKKDLIKKIEKLKEEINAKVEWITPEVAICLSLIDEFIEEIKGGEE